MKLFDLFKQKDMSKEEKLKNTIAFYNRIIEIVKKQIEEMGNANK